MKTYDGYTAYEILSQASPSRKATIAVGDILMPQMVLNIRNIGNLEVVLDELAADGFLEIDESNKCSLK